MTTTASELREENGGKPLQGFYSICEAVYYYLKADDYELKIYTINPKATSKITKQRVTANKQTKGIK